MDTSHSQHAVKAYVSPDTNSKPSRHSPRADDDNDHDQWSAGDASSGDDISRSQTGAAKRKRPLSVSCETCKQRKVKCDRSQPACGWCMKNRSQCIYLPRKKPGLRAGYGRELEARLDKLEAAIGLQQKQINQLSSNRNHNHPAVDDNHTGPEAEQILGRRERKGEQNGWGRACGESEWDSWDGVVTSPVHDGSVFRAPPILQTTHIPRPETALFLQKPSGFPPQHTVHSSLAGGLHEATHTQPINGYHAPTEELHHPLGHLQRDPYAHGNGFAPAQLSVAFNHASIGHADDDFPPYDLLYGLVDLFFKHIYPWCPILHRQTTLNSLFGEATLDEADRIVLHAIVATTLKFSQDPRLNAEKRSHYHKHSKEQVLLYGIENSSVKSLQALVILALDVIGSSNGPPGWNLLALITRSVVQLGLSMETHSPLIAPQYASRFYTLRAIVLPEPQSWIEEESRRRLFWMIYLLDRYATVATAFSFALDDAEIDRRLPCRDDLFARNVPVETRWFRTPSRSDYNMNRPENLGTFSYYIEILGILSRVHAFLKRPVDISKLADVERWQREYKELDRAIEEWKYQLPAEYGNSLRIFSMTGAKALNSGLVMLHAAFHTTVIRLHSSAAYPTHRSPIFTPSFSASQRCLSAVESLVSLCTCVRSPSPSSSNSTTTSASSSPPPATLLSKLGPPFAFSVWVAARVLLVHGSTIAHHVDPSIHLLVATLRDMGRWWDVANRYAELLTRVLHEYEESRREVGGGAGGSGGGNGSGRAGGGEGVGSERERERETPGSVRILADMRRCAFDLEFLISRQPRVGGGGGGSGGGGTGGAGTRPASAAPSAYTTRTPGPSEFEYLDVFDFFNMPRLPVSMAVDGGTGQTSSVYGGAGEGMRLHGDGNNGAGGDGTGGTGGGAGTELGNAGGNEFNITNFMVDASADWFKGAS
ncbi:uncharacterized protein EI97DRAFT_465967 [Westerdykella ornata]|uniref:Zn(2)-C6 fungal-type domain-containing protein n=1 Tax=Westerdykella ornata TaxID=318751 RepID=A0A6A6JMH4_WESOR|nr:uncharacterized protein EI97DRAFT_465967 [Westerdykella ornata]KAF2277850.1 hypothetical protein EI97DRAFT_465967 [Westerdykella ornata]